MCFYGHWFCSADISVAFVALVFKRQHNESHYDKRVTGTQTVFTERTLAGKLLVKNRLIELHTNPTDGLFTDVI